MRAFLGLRYVPPDSVVYYIIFVRFKLEFPNFENAEPSASTTRATHNPLIAWIVLKV